MTWRLACRLLLLGIVVTAGVSFVLMPLSGYLEAILPLVIISLVGIFSGIRTADLFSLKIPGRSSLALSLGLGMAIGGSFILLEKSIDYLTKGWWSQFIQRTPEAPLPNSIFLASLVTLLLGASEELLFRGFLVRAFSELGTKPSLVFPLLFFVIFHPPLNMPVALVIGLLGALLLLATDSVLPPIVMHCTDNLVGLVIDRAFPHRVTMLSTAAFILGAGLIWQQRNQIKGLFATAITRWKASPATAKVVPREWSCIVLIALGILNSIIWFAMVLRGA